MSHLVEERKFSVSNTLMHPRKQSQTSGESHMSDFDDSQTAADGRVCALFVDDRWPADKKSLTAFLESDLPGVVIPTSGGATARLVCGEQVVHGNSEIRQFLEKAKNG
jgi:hypothetical protein